MCPPRRSSRTRGHEIECCGATVESPDVSEGSDPDLSDLVGVRPLWSQKQTNRALARRSEKGQGRMQCSMLRARVANVHCRSHCARVTYASHSAQEGDDLSTVGIPHVPRVLNML